MTQAPAARVPGPHVLAAAVGVSLLALLWAYWTTLAEAADRWAHDPQYSHGYLVPGFALALLWLRRGRLAGAELRPCWWGLVLLLGGVILRLQGTYFHFAWLDPISLLPCLAGLCVLLAGWRCLAWAWPAISFLFFMIPLPYSVSVEFARPLQVFATQASTALLQILGRPAVAEGNVILLNDVELGVVEACSGLRMLVVFFALSTAVAMLISKPLWERLFVAASAVPIALLVNVIRITATGVLHETAGKEVADAVFHDLAGWLMMPVALGLLALELKILKHLLIEPDTCATPRAPAPPASYRQARVSYAPAATPPQDPPAAAPEPTPAPAAAPAPEAPAAPGRRSRRQRPGREVAKPFGRG
jgi:exosortase